MSGARFFGITVRIVAWIVAMWTISTASVGQESARKIPRPEDVIGFVPGTDRKLADTGQIEAYFRALDAASDCLTLTTFGTSSEGRPLLLAIITSPENQQRLEEIRLNHLALGTESPDRAAARLDAGRAIVSMHASIHSNEPGPAQSAMEIAWWLCTNDELITKHVLETCVVLLNPVHNPDGYDKVVDWYRRWVGTPHEGAPMVELYHKYVGHDNNRDWFMATQKETRATIEGIHRRWRPLVALDQHQMDSDGARMFLPPYQAPWDPAIPDGVVARTRELGAAVFSALAIKAREGVVTDTLFDAWSPSRSALPYHGGVRFLTEIASARFASPIDVTSTRARGGVKYEGPWSLGDIVMYNNDAALAAMGHIARNRRAWLSAYATELWDARRGVGPNGIAAPHDGILIKRSADRGFARNTLLRVLRTADVLVEEITATPTVGAAPDTPEPGDWFVPQAQPYFAAAASLLVNHPYPDVFNADGSRRSPYDVTVNHLPSLLGVGCVDLRGRRDPATVAALATGNRRPVEAATDAPESFPKNDPVARGLAEVVAASGKGGLAIYRNTDPHMPEGWMRWWCDHHGIRFRSVTDRDLIDGLGARSANDASPPRVLVFTGQTDAALSRGPTSRLLPSAFRSGLGQGADSAGDAVKAWVESGGHLVTFGASGAWAVRTFGLPLRNALVTVEKKIAVPGTALRLELRRDDPITAGIPSTMVALVDKPIGWEPTTSNTSIEMVPLARYASRNGDGAASRPPSASSPFDHLVVAGFVEGADAIAGKWAVVRARVGRGNVTMFAFDPIFRGWTVDAWPLLLNTLSAALR